MILAIPYVPGHADYMALANEIRKRGPLGRHSLLVVSDSVHADAAYDFGQTIADMFDRASCETVNYPERRPNATKFANDLFYAAMSHLKNRRAQVGEPDVPVLLYLDPRFLPCKTGWLREIQSTYYFVGAPDVFGQVVTDPDGERRFDGPVVIAQPFVRRSALVNFLNDTTHWRIYLRSEMLVSHADTRCMAGDTDSYLRVPAKRQGPGKPKPEPEPADAR